MSQTTWDGASSSAASSPSGPPGSLSSPQESGYRERGLSFWKRRKPALQNGSTHSSAATASAAMMAWPASNDIGPDGTSTSSLGGRHRVAAVSLHNLAPLRRSLTEGDGRRSLDDHLNTSISNDSSDQTSSLQARMHQMQVAMDQERAMVASYADALTKLRATHGTLEAKHAALVSSSTGVATELDQLRTAHAKLQTELETLSQELFEVRSVYTDLSHL